MTPTEVKQAADEMVANWMILLVQSLPFISYASIDNPILVATHFAIAHCKLVIEVLEGSTPGTYTNYLFKKHRLILSELERRVK